MEETTEAIKQAKTNRIVDAFFIGFLIGIVVYGVVVNSMGFFAFIPLFIAYKFLRKSKKQNT